MTLANGFLETMPAANPVAALGVDVAGLPALFPTWQVIGQSNVAVSCGADTTEDTLATITVPANSMGANGRLRITTTWTTTNSANSKTLKVKFGGTSYGTMVITASAATMDMRTVGNRNATNSQVGSSSGTIGGFGNSSATAPITSAIDTTASTTVAITGQKASSGELLTLESYSVELFYAA